MEKTATLKAWVKELDGRTTPGAETQISGGLKEVFAHLAEIDWSDYGVALATVQSCGYKVELGDMQMMLALKRKDD